MAIPGLEVTYPLIDEGPGNPNIPPGGPADAQAVRAERLRQAGVAAPTATTSTAAPNAPSAGQRLRSAGSNLVSGAAYLGAGVAGQAAARSLRDMGGDVSGPGAVVGERQAGDSASSTQIPTGGPPGAPATPGAQPYNFWTDSEAGRNIGNMANAIAPLGGVAMAARVPGAASRVAGLADAAVTGLASGVRGEREAPTPAPSTPSLRVRPEDALAGPPALAAGAAPADASAGVRRIDRPGQSPLFTNMLDGGLLGNDKLMGRGAISPQNMAAADNLAASNDITPRLRAQAQYDAEVANAQRISGMQQRMNGAGSKAAMLDLRSPEYLAARNASVTSTISRDGRPRLRSEVEAETARTRMAQDAQTAQMQNQTTQRGQELVADASRYGSDNSLRGTMYSTDSQLGAKRMEMESSLRQRAMMGKLWEMSQGKPEVFRSLAMQAGLPDAAKLGGDMAAADQTRAMKNAEDARDTFKDLFQLPDGGSDKNAEANAHIMAAKIVPGWESMSAEQRAANRTKVVDAVKLVQGMNSAKDTSWLQKFGLDSPNGAYSQLPELVDGNGKRAQVGEVGWWEGMTTPNVGRGDTVITLPNGTKRYLRGQLEESQAALLEQNGARRQR